MFITKLELYRSSRFHVRGIEKLVIQPSMKTQILLGTNGSGKSSLVRIGFTVMPPKATDFIEKKGYKILHCNRHGHEYELRTIFESKTPEHHFYCDGEDLNPGRTGSVQMELIREHFNMTYELHDVLTGQVRFTDMSPLQRREWITRLSSADFDYVIKLHNRIKKAQRGAVEVIQHQAGRLVDESAKKLGDNETRELANQSKEMQRQLATLFSMLDTELPSDYQDVSNHILRINAQIESVVERMLKTRLHRPVEVRAGELSDIQEQKDELHSERKMLMAALHEVSDQHQLIDKQIHEISILDNIDPLQLQLDIDTLNLQIATLNATFKTGLEPALLARNPNQVSAVDEVIAALHAIIQDEHQEFTREKVQAQQQTMQQLQETYRAGTSRISEIQYRLNHIANCSTIACPKCNHTFKEGVDANEEQHLRDTLRKGESFKQNMESKLESTRNYLTDARERSDRFHDIQALRDRYPYLAGLWNLFNSNGGVQRGRELIPLCRDFIHDSEKAMQIERLGFELAPLIEKMNQLKQLDQAGSLRDLHTKLTLRIAEIQTRMSAVQQVIAIVEKYYRDRMEFEGNRDVLDRLIEQQQAAFKVLVDFSFNEEVTAQIKKYQVSLALLETSLTEAEMQAGIVKDIERNLEDMKQREAALKLLERVLSPKDGLIAEQILVFINTFIDKINEVISKVWGYNLALSPCDLEDGELNYKFPMYIHNHKNVIPDIAFGSDSQVDIVNQAFRLVVYKFMRLEGYPLYLDELGRTFDEVHRHNLTLAIKDLIDDETYSQLFFISHSFESQNSYPNSQIAVLDDSHVSLKRTYNEHVEIA